MTGSFRTWALVSSSRPRSPLRLTQLPMTRLLLAAALGGGLLSLPVADSRRRALYPPVRARHRRHPAPRRRAGDRRSRNVRARRLHHPAQSRCAGPGTGAKDRGGDPRRRRDRRPDRHQPMVPMPRHGPIPRPRSGRGPASAELVSSGTGTGPAADRQTPAIPARPAARGSRCPGHPSGEHHGAHGPDPRSGEVFLLEIGRDGTISVIDEIPDRAPGAKIDPARTPFMLAWSEWPRPTKRSVSRVRTAATHDSRSTAYLCIIIL